MIEARAVVSGDDGTFVSVFFFLSDLSGAGIQSVTVTDNRGSAVAAIAPDNCPQTAEFTVHAPRENLPLWAEGTNCDGLFTPRDENGPLVVIIPDDPSVPGAGVTCSVLCPHNPDCDAAVIDSSMLYDELAGTCERCADVAAERGTAIEEIVGLSFALLAAIIVFAILTLFCLFGNVLAGIFCPAALAAGAVVIALIGDLAEAVSRLERLDRENAECREQLADLQQRYADASSTANSSCCPGCGGDILPAPC